MKNTKQFTFENIPSILQDMYCKIEEIDQKLQCKEVSSTNQSIWLSLDELCDYHPAKPKKATVYSWVHQNKIPYNKKGKKLFFLKSEIDEHLASGKVKSLTELKYIADNLYVKPSKYVGHGNSK
ncbi:helix-turn-helix domain-containing protein [Namhaeicola litoreus]|uniref:Helix-turn-helix domain-containing protein n=1 Tax=Namhaeicola litoreus TaxID=1052145 RepID=A0ABW3Y5Y9_9FLAO